MNYLLLSVSLFLGILAPVVANTSSGCASGMTQTPLPVPTANLTAVDTSIDCEQTTLGSFTNYRDVDVTIEPLPASGGDQVVVYMQPANVAKISENLDLLSFEKGETFDENVDAGMTIQFPADELTKITTGKGNNRILAAGFPNLATLDIEDGDTVIIEDLLDQLYEIDISCNGFCNVYITGNALILLSMSSGGNVYIKGRLGQGSYIDSGNLWVDGVIEGLDAESIITGRGIMTTTSCANVEYNSIFQNPCSVSSFTVTAPSNVPCAASACEEACTVREVQVFGINGTECSCSSQCDTPTQSPSGAPGEMFAFRGAWSTLAVVLLGSLSILLV